MQNPWHRHIPTLCSLLAVASLLAPGASHAQEGPGTEVTLLITAGTAGSYAPLTCEPPLPSATCAAPPTMADTLAILTSRREALRAKGAGDPIVVDVGGILGHGEFLRYALQRGQDGVSWVSELLLGANYDATALGEGELQLSPERTRPLLASLGHGNLRFGAFNVVCEQQDSGYCEFLETGERAIRVLERDGLRIALIPVLAPSTLRRVAGDHLAGMKVTAPGEGLREVVASLRAKSGVQLVVVLAHVDNDRSAPQEALTLARESPGVDVFVASSFGFRDDPALSIASLSFSDSYPILVGGPPGPGRVAEVRLLVSAEASPAVELLSIATLESEPEAPPSAWAARFEDISRQYCAAFDQPVGSVRLAEQATGEDLFLLVMEAMRRSHGSSLALLNRSAVRAGPADPAGGVLTQDRLFRLLPQDDQVLVADVPGEALHRLLAARLPVAGTASDTELRALGGSRKGDAILVNGRPLDLARRYRVVTVGFLAAGGDSLLSPLGSDLSWKAPADHEDPLGRLRSLVANFMASEKPSGRDEQGRPTLSASDLSNLWTRPLWTLVSDINGFFSHTSVHNPDAYAESALSRSSMLSLKTDSRLYAQMNTKDHDFLTRVDVLYGGSRQGDLGFTETSDQITWTNQYRWSWWRNRGTRSTIYIPTLYSRLSLESEFSIPSARSERHLQGTYDMGLDWLLTDAFSISIGYGGRGQLIIDDDLHHGLMFRYELKRTELFSAFSAPVFLESSFELFYSDIGLENILQAVGRNRLGLRVLGPLNFTVQHDLYLYRAGSGALAVSSDTQVGLQVYLDALIQVF